MPATTPAAAAAPLSRSVAVIHADVLVFDELRRLDVGIRDGVIVELAPTLSGSYPASIDAAGLVALPGLIDTAPQADLARAALQAVRGGVTTLFAETTAPTPWTRVLAELPGHSAVDVAICAAARRDACAALAPLEGQLGYAGPLLDGAVALGADDLQAVWRRGRLRVVARLGPETPLLPLLDAAMDALRPLHLVALRDADDLALLGRHPARRLTSAALAAVALSAAPGDPQVAAWLAALRDGGAAMLCGGVEGDTPGCALAEALPALLELVAAEAITWAELSQWTAQRPAQAFQLQGKGGLLPGLDGDVVLVDPRRRPRDGLAMTLSRGAVVWGEGATSTAAGAAVQLARPLAILPR